MDFVLSSPKCTLSLLSTNQSTKVEKSLFQCSSIVFIFLCWKTRLVSLAYNKSSLSTAYGMSLMYFKKSSGPKIEPCGTPHITDALSEFAFSMLIINFLFERYDVHHLIFSSVKPRKGIFLIKMLWSIISNTFCKSIRAIPVRRPELKPFVILSWRYDKQVSAE